MTNKGGGEAHGIDDPLPPPSPSPGIDPPPPPPRPHQLLPPVLSAFSDPDARVRYSACEAMYNMAKVARASCVVHVNAIFDGLFKLSADTDVQVGGWVGGGIPGVRARMCAGRDR